MNKASILVGCIAAVLCVVGVVAKRSDGAIPSVNPPASAPIAARAAAPTPKAPSEAATASLFAQSPFAPLPLDVSFDRRKVALGDRLFHEKRLSSDGTISCASCHDLATGGVDGKRFSVGVGGRVGTFNAPTVFNDGFNFRQFWDGRAATLEEQVDGPLQHPAEMSARWEDVIALLNSDAGYVHSFAEIYANGITADNMRDAIATFERSLITPNSRFDRYLRGDKDALNPLELEGLRLFTDMGCVTCHQGINLGGNMFQVLGRMGNYFVDRGDVQPADLGRYNVTKDERDKYKFKVPTLRNVELTAPYLHDGSAATLEDAVQVMTRYQIGTPLRDGELQALVAFLRTLTGESPKRP